MPALTPSLRPYARRLWDDDMEKIFGGSVFVFRERHTVICTRSRCRVHVEKYINKFNRQVTPVATPKKETRTKSHRKKKKKR